MASLPEYGSGSELPHAGYLRIVRKDDKQSVLLAVDPNRRPGADGEIYLRPGQLGLGHDEAVEVSAVPASAWAYRRAQLFTRNGGLVLGLLCTTLSSVCIDGSLALGDRGVALLTFEAATLGVFAAVSMACKSFSAVLAFLLALWFRD
ncbi:hypothetical protein [Pseudoxanthomonas mexicana]|uniref:hypothetical protein n=1 Tax=Pseudoxanthomonas mexicana TaxID=128785 RepID=UPI00398B2F48